MRRTFVESLIALAESDERIILMSGDLGFGALEPFIGRFPSRFINAGVAEQNMIGVATGMALQGFCPVVYSIGNFPTLRALEQIRNDAAYHAVNVKIVSAGTGLTYGSAGFSHFATEDIAVMSALPGVQILSPADIQDVVECTRHMCESSGVTYLRLGREPANLPPSMTSFHPGQWRWVGEGNDVALLGTGEILNEVSEAYSQLSRGGLSVRLVDCNQLWPLAEHTISQAVGSAAHALVIEEHVSRGGLGEMVAAALARQGWHGRVSTLTIRDPRTKTPGTPRFLREHFGIDAAAIVATVLAPQDLPSRLDGNAHQN
jgi:transketolase